MSFDLGAVFVRLKADTTGFTQGINSAKKSLDGFKQSTTKFSQSGTEMLSTLNRVGAALGVAGGAIAAFSVKSAGDFEQTRIAFDTMLGSAEAGKAVLKDLANFAKTTPFNFPQVADLSKQLLAYGIAQKELLPTMSALGDIAAGVGRDKLPQLVLAYGQVQTATRLTGMELRQFTEAGVPLLEELAKITGKSAGEIKSDMESGIAIPADMVKQALFNMSSEGGRFFKLMAKQSKSLQGLWSNVQDSIGFALRSIIGITQEGEVRAGSAFDVMRQAASMLVDWLGRLQDMSPELAARITSVAAAVVGTVGAFMALAAALKVVVLLSSPIMLIFALLAALVGVVLYKSFQRLQQQMANTAKTASESTGVMASESKKNMGKVQGYSQDTIDKLADIDRQMEKTKNSFLQDLAEMVRGHQDKVKELKGQIDDENQTFEEASSEQVRNNQDKLTQIEDDHARKTQSIQDDINAELAKGRKADLERVASLQAMLDQENKDYDAQKAKLDADQAEQTAKAKAEHDKRLLDLQTQLNAETTLLAKHEADVTMIKDVAIQDEIEKLKAKYAEQMAQYDRDRAAAIKADQDKSSSFAASADGMSTKAKQMSDSINASLGGIGAGLNLANVGDQIGGGMAEAFVGAFRDTLGDMAIGLSDWLHKTPPFSFIAKVGDWLTNNAINQATNDAGGSGFINWLKNLPKFAGGVRNFSGGLAMVGEHGAELVNLPRGSDVFNNQETSQMLRSPVMPNNTTITEEHYHMHAGAFMGTPGDARKFAQFLSEQKKSLEALHGGRT